MQAGAGQAEGAAAFLHRAVGNAALGEMLAGGGAPLAPALREDFEHRFGIDFSGVRVHDTPRAADAARALSAQAFTFGPNIAFAPGRFAPDTLDGKRLLGHELAHVVQQSRGGSTLPSVDGTGPLEVDAARAGEAAATGAGPVGVSGNGAVGVAAQPDPAAKAPDDETAKLQARKELDAAIADLQKQEDTVDIDADEPVTKTGPHPITTLSLLAADPSPKPFTDEQIYQPKARQQLSETIRLGEKQARRTQFWNSIEGLSDSSLKMNWVDPEFRAAAAAVDLIWDEESQSLVRDPKIQKEEDDLFHSYPDYDSIYREAYGNILQNEPPPPKSAFKKSMDFLCNHLAPCKDNLEQFRADQASGMSREEALNRGMGRIFMFGAEMLGPGQPEDVVDVSKVRPVDVGPGGPGGGFGPGGTGGLVPALATGNAGAPSQNIAPTLGTPTLPLVDLPKLAVSTKDPSGPSGAPSDVTATDPRSTTGKATGKSGAKAESKYTSDDLAENLLETIAEKNRSVGGAPVDPDIKTVPENRSATLRWGEKMPGRSEVSSRVKRSLRANARERFGQQMREALEDPSKHTPLTQEALSHLTDQDQFYIRLTGRMPEGFEFHHLLTIADFPEFGDLAESGLALPKAVHRQAGHGGDTTRPIEAATYVDPDALDRPGYSIDPEAKKGYRAKAADIAEGTANTPEKRGGVDADLMKERRARLQQLKRRNDPADAAAIKQLEKELTDVEQLVAKGRRQP